MLSTSRGIIFHTIPYSDSRVIAKIYTLQNGIESFIISVSRSKKGKIKSSMLQPLTQVEIVADRKDRNMLNSVREISCYAPYAHLQEDVIKTSIALFIAEVLYKAVKEEESNPQLYAFLENSLQILDLHHEGVANFHLCFLAQLSKYLGFYPQQNQHGDKSIFDLQNGVYRPSIPSHPLYLDLHESRLLEKIHMLSFENMHTLLLTGEIRSVMVKHLLRYYELHLHSMQDVKSHYVLEAVLG